mmetsp:Transcript_32443/g.90836  ORF Transcript_32443/g.90836 Transcript_32443/m.90836 type:complete len:105 (-) Transcript_32443:294-608(-)
MKTVCTLAFPSNYEDDDDRYNAHLRAILAASPSGEPDFEAVRRLQRDYENGTTYGRPVHLWDPNRWGTPVDLVGAVTTSQRLIACPEVAYGEPGTANQPVSMFF